MGHAATVNAIIKTVVPAASASTIQNTMSTATASGALATAALSADVVSALQADTSISSAVGNITVTATATVSEPQLVSATPGAGGAGGSTSSTSGAFAQALSAFVGLTVVGSLLI